MRLEVKRTRLLFDGFLPCDTMSGDRYMQLFTTAKPLIDYAFKVERPPYVFVWQYDRYLPWVLDKDGIGFMLELGKFYPITILRSASDYEVALYLQDLGWQVRVAKVSIDRQEYLVLAVFSALGAILEEAEEFNLLSLYAHEDFPLADPPERLLVHAS